MERFRGDPLARQVIMSLATRSLEIWQRTFAGTSFLLTALRVLECQREGAS